MSMPICFDRTRRPEEDHAMMYGDGMMGFGMWGFWLFGLLVLMLVVLGIAALIKYLGR